MKKSIYILLAFVISWLFYSQSFGLNALIASLLIILVTKIINTELRWKPFLFSSVALLLSASSVFIYSNELALTAFWFSLGVHLFLNNQEKLSFITGILSSAVNWLLSFVFVLEALFKKLHSDKESTQKRKKMGMFFYLIPIVLVIIFIVFYRNISEPFKDLTDKISLDFISWSWVWFTLGCFVFLFPTFYFRKLDGLSNLESNIPAHLQRPIKKSFLNDVMNLKTEYFAALLSFLALNVLLLVVNGLDIAYLYMKIDNGVRMSMSESVHHGVANLIWAVVFAIVVILTFYRGRINFIKTNKTLLLLSVAWIFQNAFLVFSTAYRNHLYIQDMGLTYRRIGVYVYLGLTILGLALTLVKIIKQYHNWHLVRQFMWSVFSVLVITSLINWNEIVVNSQFAHSQKANKTLDCNYIYRLSPVSLGYIKNARELCPDYEENFLVDSQNFIDEVKRRDWQSFVLRDYLTSKTLKGEK
jgi:hypothetical protein